MRISDLTRLLPDADVRGDAGTDVSGATADSRAVTPGALYFCVPGGSADGHDFAADAVTRGAAALVVERWLDFEVPQIRVPAVRDAMGPLSAAVFDHPSRAMTVVGVTGTNGKTTSAFMIEKAFGTTGSQTGLIGTVEMHVAGEILPVLHTTPEAPDLQRTLARMHDAGAGAVAMEVSSHGLALGRVAGTWFACALFTNLTRDHLDFHRTMEDYESAKAMLFTPAYAACGAVNADDAAGRRLLANATIPLVSFGLAEDADVRATDIESTRHGSRFVCVAGDERVDVVVRIAGGYNVSNALGVLAVFRALALPLAQAADGIAALDGVPGRMEG
ncbi:MAG: UDP-N-acetylmuramoyl-L-alanyl-D-glutamate--2,6-diaminopimelate ligase, partial [Actinomycetota bacterium]